MCFCGFCLFVFVSLFIHVWDFLSAVKVILENIHAMKKTIAEIMTYQMELRLPQTASKPLPVFQRTHEFLQDVKLLENVTQEQNELLKVSGFWREPAYCMRMFSQSWCHSSRGVASIAVIKWLEEKKVYLASLSWVRVH